jgi:hypothetical protein
MSNLNLTKIYIALVAMFLTAAAFFGCSENSLMNSSSSFNEPKLSPPPPSVVVEPFWEGKVLCFRVTNNMTDTIINDFHVQFDSTLHIKGWITWPGWVIDQTTTDTAKGKFGVKCGPQGQPIHPLGGVAIPLGVDLGYIKINKRKPGQWWDFTWQATRDGVVVKSGYGNFPR